MSKIEISCDNCNEYFLKHECLIKRNKNHFCSNKCRFLYQSKNNIKKSISIKYNQLTVLSSAYNKNGRSYVKCKCDCGKKCIKRLDSIKENKTKSCGKCISVKERFMKYVEIIDSSTWVWKGAKDQKGYGMFYYKGRSRRAHRVAYELFVGEIYKGMICCHMDDKRDNVNPWNIFISDNNGNTQDMIKKGRDRHLRGEDVYCSILKAKDIPVIRKLSIDGIKGTEIANRYNVRKHVIYHILDGSAWSHIK